MQEILPHERGPGAGRLTRMSAGAPSRVRFRRAVALLLMTLVLPGSAQLVAGNRRWGRIALRVVGMLAFVALVLVIVAKFWPVELSALLFDPGVLAVLRILLVLAALGWAALFVDAWRIGDPPGLGRRQRFAVFSLSGALCVVVSGALLFGSHLVSVQRSLVVDIFGHGITSTAEDGRYNVLLLGGDAGVTREGLRPDSITVASIDEDTGRTVLFSLPRNLEQVPFPEDTPMGGAFPEGFDCEGCYLNAVYTWATDHADLFPDDVGDVGAYATKRAVEEITGLDIGHYAMVDLRGFRELVDAVGGVTLNVPERLPIGGVGGPITGWIEPGHRHLDGFETLWFARSRATSDDYSRMARQKCVMNAMLTQLSPQSVLAHFRELAHAARETVTTDIPASELDQFLALAAKARRLPVASVSFVPPRVVTYDPDFNRIRAMVQSAVDRAEAADQDAADPASVVTGGQPTSRGIAQAAAGGDTAARGLHPAGARSVNQTDALSFAC
jgi:polyisoprenyl-teichoic acid--peptidoglycan teichoic acid transferase